MQTFVLYIRTDNDAFGPGADEESERIGRESEQTTNEVARILRDTADRLERGDDFGAYRTLYDANGNDVGRAAFKRTVKIEAE